jgi:hypothetical protein
MWRNGRVPNSIPIYSYIQIDATLHSLFVCGNCSACFGWYFHPLSGAHTTVSTESGICHNVTAICRYRGRVGTGLSVLWVAYRASVPYKVHFNLPFYPSSVRAISHLKKRLLLYNVTFWNRSFTFKF